eukprot:gnl/TRDRNA2_/TRDRNA2_92795_c0_seq1.p1 gnl/TRDRNA2_/TRDRNA2_92795_c0~~gnl/TRDRNA2_/TRDRNA2_92795_c0_seq1.p1  ORF type:complete len:385 (-),score=33.76 gnl/TRDRNA2_/TRDRNA2_92795_c0_seq1:235-1389(-)
MRVNLAGQAEKIERAHEPPLSIGRTAAAVSAAAGLLATLLLLGCPTWSSLSSSSTRLDAALFSRSVNGPWSHVSLHWPCRSKTLSRIVPGSVMDSESEESNVGQSTYSMVDKLLDRGAKTPLLSTVDMDDPMLGKSSAQGRPAQQRCDTLFQKSAWRKDNPSPVVPAVPQGWKLYCRQLWKSPAGQLSLRVGSLRYKLRHGDILENLAGAQAVVNSANKHLAGPARPDFWMFASYAGSSIEEALHQAAGPALLESCERLPFRGEVGIRCPVGTAVSTRGTSSLLPDGYVIHAVAPKWYAEETSGPLLRAAWRTALKEAAGLGVKVVVAPALGTGANTAPLAAAAVHCAQAVSDCRDLDLELRVVLHSYEAWEAWAHTAHALRQD